jgi:TonB-dependent receptor
MLKSGNGVARHGLLRSVSLIGLLLASAAPVMAQDAAPAAEDDVTEVVVTGFRGSLQSAIRAKRFESGVVDSIKAEDIADFPDLNLAESLQRIPGVAITRANGEGRQISVRGLGSEYTRVRVNGMEAIATTGGTVNSGGTNRTRGFDFNMFASELFNSLTVRKTASADVEEGSLGATVDLQTARPFDYKDDQFVVSAQASYNDLTRDAQPRVTMMGSRRWADGRLGALFSVAYEKRHILEEGANITRWSAGGANGGFNTQSTVAGYTIAEINNTSATTGIFHPRLPSYVSYDINTERLGLTGSFQMRPSDATLVTFDVLYSDVKTTRGEHQFQAIGLSRSGVGKPQTIIRSGIVEGRNLVQATMDNVDLRTQTAWDEMETEFTQYTLTLTHNFSDRLRGGFIAGHSQSEFSNPISTIITFDRANTQGYSYDFRSRMPAINLNFDATDPANWAMTNGTSEVRIRPNFVTNAFANAKAYLEYDFSDNLTLKGGLDYRKFTFDSRGYYRTSETRTDTLSATDLAAVSEVFSGFGRNLDQPSGNATSWLAPDLNKFAEKYDIYCNCGIYALTGTANSSARGQWINVRETNTGAYLQADFKFEALGLPWRGDAGVRHVKTDQWSSGFASTGSGANLKIERVEAERSYDMTLPSGNLATDLTDDVVLRVSAAETIARPSIAGLTPGGDVSIQGSNFSYSRGNPEIKPTKSKNLDLSLEWYPAPNSLYAAGLFYKKIDTFVQTVVERIPFDQLGLPLSLLTPTNTSPTEIFNVSQPFNSPGGELKGFEINAQQQLDFLPGFWANFGVLANYTYVDSSIDYLTSTSANAAVVNQTLIGLSKNAANFTLYYETEKFSVRGSAAYREGYLTAVPAPDGNSVAGTNETLNFDMQASYSVTPKLKLSLEGINLTDEFNDQYVDASNRLNVRSHTGRQVFLSARYSF